MTNPAATVLTPNSAVIPSKQPDGALDAKVALRTSKIQTTAMYHRRAADQFFGFSMSSSVKSTWPSSLRCGFSSRRILSDLYGLATGRERIRSIEFILARRRDEYHDAVRYKVRKQVAKEARYRMNAQSFCSSSIITNLPLATNNAICRNKDLTYKAVVRHSYGSRKRAKSFRVQIASWLFPAGNARGGCCFRCSE